MLSLIGLTICYYVKIPRNRWSGPDVVLVVVDLHIANNEIMRNDLNTFGLIPLSGIH
jgi:hypothetical protein